MSDLATWSLAGVTVVGWAVIFALLQHGGQTGRGKTVANRIGGGGGTTAGSRTQLVSD